MGGYKQWDNGDVLTPGDIDEFLMGQTTMRFPDADARGAALPSPDDGTRAFLTNTGQEYIRRDDHWHQVQTTLKMKTVDTSRASQAILLDDDELALIRLPIGSYQVESLLAFDAPSGDPDAQVAYSFSGTITAQRRHVVGHVDDDAGQVAATNADITAAVHYGLDGPTSVRETLLTVSAAGDLTLKWAQQTSDTDATVLLAGSAITVHPVIAL